MFERYAEGSRRVIFYARDAAFERGSATIEPYHLLLGAEREDKQTAERFIAAHPAMETVRESDPERGPAVDLTKIKFSQKSKRALAWAAESSDKEGSRSIGPLHLLAGLLRGIENPEANRPARLSPRGRLGCIVDRLRGVR